MNYFLKFAAEQIGVGVSGNETSAPNSDWWDFTASELKVELMNVVHIRVDVN